ncbi:MAG: hypothetical protein RLZZ301_514 [Bacteroidota bacterium]|jgi:UPF0755 protein
MSKRTLIYSAIAVCILGLLLFSKTLRYAWYAFSSSSNKTMVRIYIPNNATSPDSIAAILIRNQILDDATGFLAVGAYKKCTAQTTAAGMYEIAPNTALRHLWNGFTRNAMGNGNAEKTVKVSFENCRSLNDLAGKLAMQLELDSAAFIAYIQNGKTLQRLGFSLEQMPALFIPNTYELYWDQSPADFVGRMAQEFKNFWTSERKAKLQQVGLQSPSEAVTLASIVYSEQSVRKEEWPIIAGLYLNRIKQGIKLQSDPTFKFCWGDALKGVGRLLAVHRDIDCPYNTYKIKGLPPGPIYLPPVGVVDAVLNPGQHDYIFMCAKPDHSMTHNFTASGAVHLKNATAFQHWLDIGQP